MDTTNYWYDDENRLVEVQTGTSTVYYTYDADGIRVSSEADSQITDFLVDKNRDYAQVLEERDGIGSLNVAYVYGDDLISQERGGNIFYYQYDGHMSTRALTNAAGSVTDEYTYDAFGSLTDQAGTTVNHYLYSGEQYDPNIGFYYLRARYYNTSIGRFVTTDPFEGLKFEPATLHRYLYAANNPVMYSDPSGEMTLLSLSITGSLIGTLAGGSIVYYYGDIRGGIGGAAVGAVVGWYATYYLAYEFLIYIPAAMQTIHSWFLPSKRFLQGPTGRVLLSRLDQLSTTSAIRLYTNLSRTVDLSRSISMASTRELAGAGGRAVYQTFVFNIPQGVIKELQRVGLVKISRTFEAGVEAVEYHFLPAACAYISKYMEN